MIREHLRQYALLWLAGLYLRLSVLVVPPLSLRLEEILGFSTGEVAMATSLPALLIGGCALIGAWLAVRFGAIATVVAGLLVMAAGSSLRSLPVGFALFLLATTVMGGGIALMHAGLPLLSRVWLPQRVGRASAVYANGLLAGELLGAGVTGPLVAHWLGDDWRLAFALWVVPVPLIAIALAFGGGSKQAPPPSLPVARAPLSWRDPLLWRVAILMGSAGGLYYCGNIFLPPILAASDRIHLLDAGLGALNGFQLVSSVLLMIFADHLLGRRWPLLLMIAVGLAAIVALLWLPGQGVVWAAALVGMAASSLLIVSLALPAWLVPVSEVSRLAAGVLAAGNLLTFLLPVLGGWTTDATGSVAAGFLPTVIVLLLGVWAAQNIRRRD